MPEFKILISDGLEENGKILLRQRAHVDDRDGISPAELLSIIADYQALIVRGRTRVTGELLAAAKILRVVGRSGVGVDNIDLDAARVRGITVVNAPLSTSIAVAELTFGLMLALARSIPAADAGMKNGQWLKKQLQGVELFGKMLGILGMGNIGQTVAQRAATFGMSVLGYDPFLPAEQISKYGARPVGLDELFAQADFISLHLPLTQATLGMIDQEAISNMKVGVRLISTARGGVVNEEALLAALETGQIAGAALDVFSQEPPGLTPLVAHPNLIAVPHIGAQTTEAQARAAADIANEVLAALHDQPLRWQVA
jgi:D-3-phosphoglycerate dehydrogenase